MGYHSMLEMISMPTTIERRRCSSGSCHPNGMLGDQEIIITNLPDCPNSNVELGESKYQEEQHDPRIVTTYMDTTSSD
jgi:hypothetical protein